MTDASMFVEVRRVGDFKSGLGRLPTYRVYHVGTDGRLAVGETFSASTDAEAVARAGSQLIPGRAAELWQGGRLVGQFSKAHEFTAGG
jgi:hypothetical protein